MAHMDKLRKVNENNCKIYCPFHDKHKRGFYLDSNLDVYPCCHYASIYGERNVADEVPVRDKSFEESLEQNPGWNNLSNNRLEVIKQHEQYQQNINYPGWETNPTDVCNHFCNKYK